MTNKIKSDGGSSSYYRIHLPSLQCTIETQDIIKHALGNDFDLGNVQKSLMRIQSARSGYGKDGIDELYDWRKILYTAEKNIQWLEELYGPND